MIKLKKNQLYKILKRAIKRMRIKIEKQNYFVYLIKG